MKKTPNKKPGFSSKQILQLALAVVLMGIAVLLLIVLVALWFPQIWPGQPAQVAPTLPPTSVIPTLFVPTPDCGPPTLVLGSTTYQIQNLAPAPDGSLTVPSDTPGVVYWVEGTNDNYVFVLSPTPENISLASTLTAGNTAKATWSNCNSTTYNLYSYQPGFLDVTTLSDQSVAGITIFLQIDSTGNGFILGGEPIIEEQFFSVNTPGSSEKDIQANIALLETTTAPDGTTIQIGISVNNYGDSAFTLATTDVLLLQQDAIPLVMISSEPQLPKEIAAKSTETFYFTFPRPTSPSATFKILSIEYDIEEY